MNIDESYKRYYDGPKSDHFDGEKFFNPWRLRPEKGLWDVFKWRMTGKRAKWPDFVENPPRPALEASSQRLRATYVGHATILVQTAGINLLIDPVFSERCSPIAGIGPKRVTKPFVAIEDLPKIDCIFVSHNHYDHMDLPSLSKLASEHAPLIITPLGNTRLMENCVVGCTMKAVDWHETIKLANDLTLTLTPAQHWSRRGLNDTSRDLWGGCVLKDSKQGKSLFYCGDSGFDESLFKDIRTRHGAPDIALLPIGAYEPRWFMAYSHMNPDDSVRAFQILEAKKAIGFHFETFQLTDEAFGDPRKHTRVALNKYKIEENRFLIPYPGDFLTV